MSLGIWSLPQILQMSPMVRGQGRPATQLSLWFEKLMVQLIGVC